MGLGWIVVRLFEYGLARCLSETVPKSGTGWCTRVLPWAHRLLPGRSRILHLYLTWLDWKGKNTAAIEVLTRRISIVIADYGLVCQLAWALADSGDLEQAELWLEQAKRMNPDNPCLFDTEAWIEFRKKGHYQAAYAKLAEALPFAPHSPDISYHAGAVLSRLNRREEAIAYLRMALEFVRPFGGRESATALLAGLTARNPST
jgi:tetratricopeptide (TPR) repeat protein